MGEAGGKSVSHSARGAEKGNSEARRNGLGAWGESFLYAGGCMYSIVLMMAMSGPAAEAPSFGRHSCHGGCTGAVAHSCGVGCHGHGLFGGMHHGCPRGGHASCFRPPA